MSTAIQNNSSTLWCIIDDNENVSANIYEVRIWCIYLQARQAIEIYAIALTCWSKGRYLKIKTEMKKMHLSARYIAKVFNKNYSVIAFCMVPYTYINKCIFLLTVHTVQSVSLPLSPALIYFNAIVFTFHCCSPFIFRQTLPSFENTKNPVNYYHGNQRQLLAITPKNNRYK